MKPDAKVTGSRNSSSRWFIGMMMAGCFSMIYFIAPFYMISAVFVLVRYSRDLWAWIYVAPILLSALIPSVPLPSLIRCLTPMLDYFEYDEILETSPVNVGDEMVSGRKNYMLVCQPHGALSCTGIVSAIHGTFPELQGRLTTAVADAVLYTPLLKHVLGIFGLSSASKKSMQRRLRRPGVDGSIVLYVGGMAELFLSCDQEERLFLTQRKGFIKLALTEGVDVVPVYLFGNTTTLSVWKTGLLATLSRKLGVSLTYMWGKYYLPIPRDCKLLYVGGQPLGMPKIEHPTQADIDKWHAKYCAEVARLFDTYKERVPEYKHKKLEIL